MRKNSRIEDTLCVIPPETPLEGFASLATPVYRGSTIVFPNAAAYRTRASRAPDGYTYGLSGTPTTRTLEMQLSEMHHAERSIIIPSGQAGISVVFLSTLQKGDHLLVTDNVYPPVKQLVREVMAGLGVEAEFFDPTDLDGFETKLRPGQTRLVWLESPGSTSMEIADIPAIASLAKKAEALVGCDNTWATGLLCKPLDLGVDVVVEALTKYVGGHSDILLGAVILNNTDLYARIRRTLSSLGVGVSPDECSLALRGIQTMALRLRHVGNISEEFAFRLSREAAIEVLHPCLPAFGNHDIWKRDFKGSSGVFSLRLTGISDEMIDRRLDSLKTFAIGASWGGTRSLVVPMVINNDRDIMSPGASSTYLRVSIGLENANDLWLDLQQLVQV